MRQWWKLRWQKWDHEYSSGFGVHIGQKWVLSVSFLRDKGKPYPLF